jgi:hypothetical protein
MGKKTPPEDPYFQEVDNYCDLYDWYLLSIDIDVGC